MNSSPFVDDQRARNEMSRTPHRLVESFAAFIFMVAAVLSANSFAPLRVRDACSPEVLSSGAEMADENSP